MTGFAIFPFAISKFTLAAYADMGWYTPDFALAEPLLWGLNRGCGFPTTGACATGGNEEAQEKQRGRENKEERTSDLYEKQERGSCASSFSGFLCFSSSFLLLLCLRFAQLLPLATCIFLLLLLLLAKRRVTRSEEQKANAEKRLLNKKKTKISVSFFFFLFCFCFSCASLSLSLLPLCSFSSFYFSLSLPGAFTTSGYQCASGSQIGEKYKKNYQKKP